MAGLRLSGYNRPELKSGATVPIALQQFLDSLTRSGLLSAAEVTAFLEHLPPDRKPHDGDALARELVQAKKLTRYQAAAVYQGKIKGLAFGEYVVLDKLGEGGMGVVLKAQHRRMKRLVAVKMLPAGKMKSADSVKRFYHEVEAAARLSHPNIVTAYDAGEHEGIQYLVMEYVDGQDLASLVKQHGPFSVSQAVECIVQAAKGLDYAHKHGVIHRDIKPGNLLLDHEGTLKILDMGLAHITESADDPAGAERLTSSGQVMGTCDYMAPEQAEDTRKADHRADIYSLGCTLYRLLVGKPPYTGETAIQVLLAHIQQPIPSLCAMRGDVPAPLEAIYQKMLAKRPEDRYQSMAEVVTALESVRSGQTESGEASSDVALKSFIQTLQNKGSTAVTRTAATLVPAAKSLTAHEETLTYQAEHPTTEVRHKRLLALLRQKWVLVALGSLLGLITVGLLGVIFVQKPDDADGSVGMHEKEITTGSKPKPPPPLAIAPFDAQQAQAHQWRWAAYLRKPLAITNSIGMKLVLIPPGEFDMGSTPEEIAWAIEEAEKDTTAIAFMPSEGPRHRVRITKAFYLGMYEVTQAEYERVSRANPSSFSAQGKQAAKVTGMDTSRHPVETVSWEDAKMFCDKLSAMPGEQAAARVYRLPTEAQWEYACRAGTTTKWSCGDDVRALGDYAWYSQYLLGRTDRVGERKPNGFSLCDMHGNVSELCWDWYAKDWYASSPADDPTGPMPRSERVHRGGSSYESPSRCRSAFRRVVSPEYGYDAMGFRVACKIGDKAESEKPRAEGADLPAWKPGSPVARPKPVTLDLKPEPLQIKPGEPMSMMALVTNPAPIPRVLSWTLETKYHRGEVNAIAYQPGGRLMATGGEDGATRLWDAKTGELVRLLLGQGPVKNLSWSPDGKFLASCSRFHPSILIWDAASGVLLRDITNESCKAFWSIAWSPDGRSLAAGRSEPTILVWDLASGTPPMGLQGHGSGVWSLAWSPDGRLLASTESVDQTVRLWDVRQRRLLQTFRGADGSTYGVAFAPDGSQIACAHFSNNVPASICKVPSGKLFQTMTGMVGYCSAVAWSPDGASLAGGSHNSPDVAFGVWNPTTGEVLWKPPATPGMVGAKGLAYSPDGKTLAAGSETGMIDVREARSGQAVRVIPGHGYTPGGIDLSPDGSTLAWPQFDTKPSLRLCETDSGALRHELAISARSPSAPVFSPDGRIVAVPGTDSRLSLCDVSSAHCLKQLRQPTGGFLRGIAWSLDGKSLAMIAGNTAMVWDLVAERELWRLDGDPRAVAFSPDGKRIAVAAGREIRLGGARTGKVDRTLTGLEKEVFGLGWSPNGRYLVAGAGGREVGLWDTESGSCLFRGKTPVPFGYPSFIHWLDEKRILLGNSSGLCVWDGKSPSPSRTIQGEFSQSSEAPPTVRQNLAAFPGPGLVRLRAIDTGQLLHTILCLRDGQWARLNSDGHFAGSPGVEKELVYVVQTDAGQETLTPEEFSKKYGWKNDPAKVAIPPK